MLLLLIEYASVPLAVDGLLVLGLLHGTIREGLFVTDSAEAAMVVYSAIALRRVYGVGWLWGIVQTLAILVGYSLLAQLLVGAAGIA